MVASTATLEEEFTINSGLYAFYKSSFTSAAIAAAGLNSRSNSLSNDGLAIRITGKVQSLNSGPQNNLTDGCKGL